MIALFAFVMALDAGTAASPIANGAREAGAGASAPAPTASPVLRNAKAILSDYAKAIGDESLWRRHKSLRVKRVVKVESMHFVSEDSTRIARGGKLYEESQLPDMGTFRRGSDGKIAWAEDPIGGLRVLKGAEAEDVRLGAAWDSEWHLADLYAEALSIPPPAGAPAGLGCECVELRKKKAQPTRICFDRATHLRVWEQGVQAAQGGQVPYATTFSDWQRVDGVLVWHHEVVSAGPVTMDDRIVEFVFDEPTPISLFMLPRKR
ncbi:MAG: hypothetical protein ABSB49_07340 [Polyangia bacterium]